MEKVLITGAYGFLGRHVVNEIKNSGYEVIAFGKSEEKLAGLKDGSVSIAVGDFTVADDIIKATEGVDYVIHCGAKMANWGRKEDFVKVNVGGTQNVINACRVNGVKRLVYTSSPSCRPLEDNLAFREEDYNVNNHISAYVESKIMAEQLIKDETVVPWSAIRPRGLFGVGDRHLLPQLLKLNSGIGIPLFEKGEVVIDLCCIENVALALRLCMEKESAEGEIFNITNGEPRRLKELCEELLPLFGVEPRFCHIPFGPVYAGAAAVEGIYKLFGIYDKAPPITRHDLLTISRSQVFDITKAKTVLGYTPKITIREEAEKMAAQQKAAAQ